MKHSVLLVLFFSACAGAPMQDEPSSYMMPFRNYGVTGVVRHPKQIFYKYRNIAVTDFKTSEKDAMAGTEIADMISIELLKRGYLVVERDHLKTLLKEKYLNYVGVINPSTFKEFQSVSGADAIITGIVGSYSSGIGAAGFQVGNIGSAGSTPQSEVSITIKMFDIETGEILLSVAGAKAGQEARGELAQNIVAGAFYGFPVVDKNIQRKMEAARQLEEAGRISRDPSR